MTKTLKEFAQPTISEAKDSELVKSLEARGFVVTKDRASERAVRLSSQRSGVVRFAVVSDTHLGNRHQQLTYWQDFTEKARAWNIDFMLHGGDIVDGGRMHKDQEFELFKHGADAQAKYAREMIPKARNRRGSIVPTYMIGGNHDGSFWVDAGANVVRTIVDARPDLHFLGAPAATFSVGPLSIYLLHPDGGPSYARSYRLQKIVEQLAPDTKPHFLLAGHWHVASHLPAYRNVEAFSLPCFESQTPYLRRKGLAPVIGGLMIEAEYGPKGLLDFQTKWVIYRTPMSEDF